MAIFLLFLLALSLTIAAPRIAKEIQRDREVETMQRGLQYRRAIQLYYRQFHAYPPNIDALVKTNNVRFLRKRYIDPMTGKDDWKPVLFGQNKAPTALGFFGQPLTGGASTLAGVGPGGGNSGLGGSTLSGGFGSTSGTGGSFGSPTGSGSLFGSTGAGSSTLPGSGGTESGATATGAGGAAGSTGSTGSTSGLSGQTFGGAGIIGFEPGSPRQSILLYKKKDHYNEWEFVYDPISDMKMIGGSSGIGQSATSLSNGTNGTSGTGGSSTNGSGGAFGGSGGGSFGGSSGGSTFGSGSGSLFGGSGSNP